MDRGELIELFYNRTYETFVNKQILDDKNYIVPRQQLINYVRKLVNIPYIDFIEYIKQHRINRKLGSSDITYFSSFSTCEIEMCNALIWANNPGYQYVDIGRLFPNKRKLKNDVDYKRFGESHVKASAQLGLTFEYYNNWYLSCLGYILPNIDKDERNHFFARTITRNQLYQSMLIDILDHDIDPYDYLNTFSKQFVKKRLNNVCFYLRFCLKECVYNNINTYKIIDVNNELYDNGFSDIVIVEKTISQRLLPETDKLSALKIAELFLNTTTTYKYYWFLSILQIYKIKQIHNIYVVDIVIWMIAIAWRILSCRNISFGSIDSLKQIVKELQKATNLSENTSFNEIIKVLSLRKDDWMIKRHLSILYQHVPYRFLSPWIEYSTANSVISKSLKFKNGCIYAIHRSLDPQYSFFYISLNPDWLEYLTANTDKLISFTYRKLADFLESKNPGVSNMYEIILESMKEGTDVNYTHPNYNRGETESSVTKTLPIIHSDKVFFSLEGGSPLSKERFVHEVIKHYVQIYKDTTLEKITSIFPKSLRKNSEYGVVELLSTVNIKSFCDPSIKSGFFMERSDIIKLKKGEKVVVNKQWEEDFDNFLNVAISLFDVKIIYGKKKK